MRWTPDPWAVMDSRGGAGLVASAATSTTSTTTTALAAHPERATFLSGELLGWVGSWLVGWLVSWLCGSHSCLVRMQGMGGLCWAELCGPAKVVTRMVATNQPTNQPINQE